MKQGTQFTLRVELEGLDITDVEYVEFVFKRNKRMQSIAIKSLRYPEQVQYADGSMLIPWTMEETYAIPAGEKFYMDTRIHLKSTQDMPETPIVSLVMNPTLFEEGESL